MNLIMRCKGLEFASFIFDVVNIAVFFFSLSPASTFPSNRILTGLSVLAILAFSSVPFLEHFRKLEIDNIRVRTAPRDEHENLLYNIARDNSATKKYFGTNIANEVAKWEEQQQQAIQGKNAQFIGWEKFSFFIGLVISLGIASYYFGFWNTP